MSPMYLFVNTMNAVEPALSGPEKVWAHFWMSMYTMFLGILKWLVCTAVFIGIMYIFKSIFYKDELDEFAKDLKSGKPIGLGRAVGFIALALFLSAMYISGVYMLAGIQTPYG